MRTQKKWTNVTFTRRVDREAGRHRGAAASPGIRICKGCGAMYARRRWSLAATPAVKNLRDIAYPERTLCPACRQIARGQFSGEVRVGGTFATAHRAEVERLIRNEAGRAAEDNPLARIVRLDRLPDQLRIRTTTEHLAKRLGQALKKAFDGRVQYRFSEENKFAHVMWSRES